MAYNVNQQSVNVNSMIHIDLNKAELDSLKSTKLPGLIQSWRIQEIAVYRTIRTHQNGGFGNPSNHPHVWSVAAMADGQWLRVHNARGQGREWSNLDRLEKWLREQGISRWQLVNDIDPTPPLAAQPI